MSLGVIVMSSNNESSMTLSTLHCTPSLREAGEQSASGSLWRQRVWAYGFAVIATAGSLLLRLALQRWMKDDGPFLFFAPAVVFSAWFGGFGPGVLATLGGAIVADWFLLEPIGMFSIA